MTAQQYLSKLKADKDHWEKAVDALPGDCISTNNPYYQMATNAANKYAAAKHMMKLMQKELAAP